MFRLIDSSAMKRVQRTRRFHVGFVIAAEFAEIDRPLMIGRPCRAVSKSRMIACCSAFEPVHFVPSHCSSAGTKSAP